MVANERRQMDFGEQWLLYGFLGLVAIALWLIISIPAFIAKRRGIPISSSTMGTIRILSFFGLVFGVTWIVALVLACVTAPPRH